MLGKRSPQRGLFEADALCDRIGIIASGQLLAEGTPAQLKARVADRTVVDRVLGDGAVDREGDGLGVRDGDLVAIGE